MMPSLIRLHDACFRSSKRPASLVSMSVMWMVVSSEFGSKVAVSASIGSDEDAVALVTAIAEKNRRAVKTNAERMI